MLVPADYGLPEKFKEYRPNQLEIAATANVSKKYAYLIDSPTGTGKSIIAATIQRMSGNQAIYLTTTKQLQDQLLADFPYARTIKGRTNYKCLVYPKLFPRISADTCTPEKMNYCPFKKGCPYVVAKTEAMLSCLPVLNIAYYLSEVNYLGDHSGFNNSKLLIIDEFDAVEDQLMNFVQLVITQKRLDSLGLEPPKYKTKFDSWVDWAKKAIKVLEAQLHALSVNHSDPWETEKVEEIKKKTEIERLYSKLIYFVKHVNKNWVWYPEQTKWTFKPVWISDYSGTALWQHTSKVVGMSATILDPLQVSANVGLGKDGRTYAYKALPSPFPKENRPIYYNPVADVTAKNMNVALPAITKAIERIINENPNDKILIHTVSYKIKQHLMDNIHSKRIISHSTFDRAEVLAKFKKSKDPLILISPSMDRGVDLPKEECRVIIIAKMPYPSLGDPQIKKRIYGSRDGNRWYAHRTISTIIQMSGRGVRSKDDYAKTYILDKQFSKLYYEHSTFFPAWFKEAVVT